MLYAIAMGQIKIHSISETVRDRM